MGHGSYDDAYITYRVAHNLSSGLGFTYNAGDPTFSTTTPLLTLILAFMGMLGDPDMIPVFGQWLTGMALTLLSCAFLWMADVRSKIFAGFIPALYLVTNPALSYVWGGETLWLILFIVLAFYFYTNNCPTLSAVCAGLAFLTRGEGVLAADLSFWVF